MLAVFGHDEVGQRRADQLRRRAAEDGGTQAVSGADLASRAQGKKQVMGPREKTAPSWRARRSQQSPLQTGGFLPQGEEF
ncbi:MAG: hypothetical protein AMK72_10650 [Planctomycetes bacterium SM23_25]|nr:MAG: hypothetical protein AMK72_10650 [Planctomycetes bacterium SM23_25]